ncbi:cadherin domain-containing protein [Pacificimonas sp. WHA3]|uniref:Cadherin domain-containing protein n=1 Tax=Pacificimonas pallii TaxID=2827236 RepID=A0ABS6SG55_9SPHN|nr:cadherin domain-containing protein [Pacificimonas pallii]MBV7257405.1 cadherin domain-containing protein [Pacificimonas pallii]
MMPLTHVSFQEMSDLLRNAAAKSVSTQQFSAIFNVLESQGYYMKVAPNFGVGINLSTDVFSIGGSLTFDDRAVNASGSFLIGGRGRAVVGSLDQFEGFDSDELVVVMEESVKGLSIQLSAEQNNQNQIKSGLLSISLTWPFTNAGVRYGFNIQMYSKQSFVEDFAITQLSNWIDNHYSEISAEFNASKDDIVSDIVGGEGPNWQAAAMFSLYKRFGIKNFDQLPAVGLDRNPFTGANGVFDFGQDFSLETGTVNGDKVVNISTRFESRVIDGDKRFVTETTTQYWSPEVSPEGRIRPSGRPVSTENPQILDKHYEVNYVKDQFGNIEPGSVLFNGELVSKPGRTAEEDLKAARTTQQTMIENHCFGKDTKIGMADGSKKSIIDVCVGDKVIAFDLNNEKFCEEVVLETHRVVSNHSVVLFGKTITSLGHKFLCCDNKYYELSEIIERNLSIKNYDGSIMPVTSKDVFIRHEQIELFNLTVGRLNNFIANNLLAHNTSLVTFFDPDDSLIEASISNDGTFFARLRNAAGNENYLAGQKGDDGNTELVEKVEVVDFPNHGEARIIRRWDEFEEGGEPIGEPSLDFDFSRSLISGEQIGSLFGGILGRHLVSDPLGSVASSTVLGAVMGNLGEAAQAYFLRLPVDGEGLPIQFDDALDVAFTDFGIDLASSGAGAVSAFLTGELLASLGIDGAVGSVLQQSASTSVATISNNLLRAGTINVDTGVKFKWNDGLDGAVGNAFGSFLGTFAASQIVAFDTIGGQLGSSIGASIGSAVAGKLLGDALAGLGTALAGPAGAAIGAFVGFLLGGLIGSVFGGTPRSGGDVSWDSASGMFVAENFWARKGGSIEAAANINKTVADTYNSVLSFVGGRLSNFDEIDFGGYGLRKDKWVWWKDSSRSKNAIAFRSTDFAEVTNVGVHHGISKMEISGGDTFLKRALYNGIELVSRENFVIEGLYSDLLVGKRFSEYFQNQKIVNAIIASSPDSAFSAEWAITFVRASELGILERHKADWFGGYSDFLAREDAVSSNVKFYFETDYASGKLSRVISDDTDFVFFDTIFAASTDIIDGSTGADRIKFSGNFLEGQSGDLNSGVLVNGGIHDTADHKINVAATVVAGSGDDVVMLSDRGDNALGGAGNDTLYGGRLDDWLLGGDGDDTLVSGSQSGGLGGDGNYLDGGDGNDTLTSREGSDWLEGGAGNDVLIGAGGDDILSGGGGDDTVSGGAGDDQYIYRAGGDSDIFEDDGVSYGTGQGQIARIDTAQRIADLTAGLIVKDWIGDTPYVERTRAISGRSGSAGHAAGGRDALVLGAGIRLENIAFQRNGEDMLVLVVDDQGVPLPGQVVRMVDWMDPFKRIEILRLADGTELEIGNFASFTRGTQGDDVIVGTSYSDFVHGGSGNDVIYTLGGDDVGIGGAGDDFISAGTGRDIVLGADSDDHVMGGADADVVTGGRGNDRVFGQSGDDIVAGEAGNDLVVGGSGDDIFRFSRGHGHDIVFDAFTNDWINVWQLGEFQNGHYTEADSLVIRTREGALVFDGSNWLLNAEYDWENGILRRHMTGESADSGNDTLEFDIGIDVADIQMMTADSDLILGIGESNAESGGFASLVDSITLKDWQLDWGTAGKPIEQFSFFNTGLLDTGSIGIWGGGGTDGDDTIVGGGDGDWLTGNAGDDFIEGLYGDDILNGNGGQDILDGGTGDDVLFGGAGDDVLRAGQGDDILIGGSGNDTVDYSHLATYATYVNIYLDHEEFNTEDAAGDTYESIENITGSRRKDRIYANDGDNVIEGGAFSDTLWGGGGDDTYVYGEGTFHADTIHEGEFAVDGTGVATLTGGDGGLDTIELDRISDISELNPRWQNGNDLQLRITGNLNSIIIKDQRLGGASAVELLQFQDGLTIDLAHVFYLYGGGLIGGAENDLIVGSPHDNVIEGHDGNDALGGASGDDSLYGGAGDDSLEGNIGADHLDGGAHTVRDPAVEGQNVQLGDTIRYVVSDAAVTVDLAAGTGSGGHAQGDTIVNVENIVGSAGYGDTLSGDANDNWLKGLAGDDTLDGRGGDDVLYGGDGNDVLTGGAGIDAIYGGDGDDALTGGDGNDQLYGDAGADTLDGGDGDDTLAGGEGDDILTAGSGNDALQAYAGSDTLSGGDGNDVYLLGGNGNHTITAGAGYDDVSLTESRAEDLTFEVVAGDLKISDTLTGMQATIVGWASGTHGVRSITASNAGLSKFDLETALQAGGVLGWEDLESVWQSAGIFSSRAVYEGTSGVDTLAGDPNYFGGATFEDKAGNDLVTGTDFDDTFLSGAGDDHLNGGEGNDTFISELTAGFDYFDGGAGFDEIVIKDGDNALGIRTLTSIERIRAETSSILHFRNGSSVNIDLSNTELVGIERLELSSLQDSLIGSVGDDHILAGAGVDIVDGGTGNDRISGGAGSDTLSGGAGTDQLDLSTEAGDWTVDLTAGTATNGTDTDTIDGFEDVTGSDGNDHITGNDLANRIAGGAGDDELFGGAGDDVLVSSEGVDSFDGGAGNDTIDHGHATSSIIVDLDAGTFKSGLTATQSVASIENVIGGSASDTFFGDDTNNRFTGLSGNDTIIGRGGADTAVYFGISSDYNVQAGTNGNYTVQDINAADGDEGQDSLSGIRYLAFADQIIDLNPDNVAPRIVTEVPDLAADEDGTFSFTVPADAFADDNGDDFQISATLANGDAISTTGWLNYDEATRTFSGIPGDAHVGTLSIAISARDSEFITTQIFELEVRNVNDAPTAVIFAGSVDENAPAGTVVGNAVAVDDDLNDTHRYLLIDPSGLFQIDGATGAVTVAAGAEVDFEDDQAHDVTIAATDASGASVEQTFVISVNDINEAPSDIEFTGSSSIDENETGALLGYLGVIDDDSINVANGQHLVTISDDRFEISGSQLRLKSGIALDYEAGDTSITLTITATDQNGAGLAYQKDFVFAVNDLVDVVNGTSSRDILNGASGADEINGFDGNDHLYGHGGADILQGGAGLDRLYGGSGADYLYGQADNDHLYGEDGDDYVYGGSGNDYVNGEFGHDHVYGGAGDDDLHGQRGNDYLDGGDGADVVSGGDGDDTLLGAAGNDRLYGDGGDDVISGGAGNDVIYGGTGQDHIDGGSGDDILTYYTATSGVTVDLELGTGSRGQASGDTITSIEQLFGTTHDDVLYGSSRNERLEGYGGNDILYGRAGDDILRGREGDDTLYGGDGADKLYGNEGNDTLYGEADGDELYGGDGNDTLNGGAGGDKLYGEAGDDILNAGDAGDNLYGGAGNDILTGGNGDDNYHFDRMSGEDIVHNYDADGGQDQLSFGPTVTKDHLWFEKSGRDVIVSVLGTTTKVTVKDWYDINGNPSASFVIEQIVGGDSVTNDIDVEGLIATMAAHSSGPPPGATEIPAAIQAQVDGHWYGNAAPVVTGLASVRNFTEDSGPVSQSFTVSDDFTALASLQVVDITSSNEALLSSSLITVSGTGATRTLTFAPNANASGSAIIRFAVDDGGLKTLQEFTVNFAAVADAPTLALAQANGSVDSGNEGMPIGLDIAAALTDTSETLEIEISGVPASGVLNKGSRQESGNWLLSAGDLAGLTITPAVNGAGQDLNLTVTARSYDGGDTAETVDSIAIAVNGAPTANTFNFNVDENVALGTMVGTVYASDPDPAAHRDGDIRYRFANGTLTSDDGLFTIGIDSGAIKVAAGVDYEALSGVGHQVSYQYIASDRNGNPGHLSDEGTVAIAINDVNEAPVLNPAYDAILNTIDEDATETAGRLMKEMLSAAAITDPEGNGLESIALVAVDGSKGIWQYRLASNGGWVDVGSVSETNALLLGEEDRLRLKPKANFNGTISQAITFKAWDESSGVAGTKADASQDGGASAFSVETDTARIKIVAVNDAPIITGSYNLPTISEDPSTNVGHSITDMVRNGRTSDPDGAAPISVAIIGASSSDGQWQYSVNSGTSWNSLANASSNNARLLAGTSSRVRFVPNANFNGVPSPITMRAWDMSVGVNGGTYAITQTGGTTAFSSATSTSTITVSPTGDNPDRPTTSKLVRSSFVEGEARHLVTLTSIDVDGPTPALEVSGQYAAHFEIRPGNQLWSKSNIRYEDFADTTPTVSVIARDGTNRTSAAWNGTFTIIDRNEAPTASFSLAQPKVVEQASSTIKVGTVNISDPDPSTAANGQHKIGFYYNGVVNNHSQDGRFRVVGNDIYVLGNIDYENSGPNNQYQYVLHIRDRNGGAGYLEDTVNITIPVGDLPFAPTFVQAPSSPNGTMTLTADVWTHVTYFRLEDDDGDDLAPIFEVQTAPGSQGLKGTYQIKALSAGLFSLQIKSITGGVSGEDTVTIEAKDVVGATGPKRAINVAWVANTPGGLPSYPVALDLDGEGIELISLADSNTKVDMNGDGKKDVTGWIGPDDGWLVLDRDGDGKIAASEISFINDTPGATSDLEGLAIYDTNGNGLLDSRDERFSEFQVWQDRNSNGRSTRRELMSLAEAGIEAIELKPKPTGQIVPGATDNVITGTSRFFRQDGSVGEVGDVALMYIDRATRRRRSTGDARPRAVDAALLTTIIVDIENDGVSNVRVRNGPNFDQDGDGDAGRVGWIGASDGFLVRDGNGNGVVDGADELRIGANGDSGFAALRTFDADANGLIDQNDAVFSSLKVWRDLDQNGVSSQDEIFSLADIGIDHLSLETLEGRRKLRRVNNTETRSGEAYRGDGSSIALAEIALGISSEEAVDNDAILPQLANILEYQGGQDRDPRAQSLARRESLAIGGGRAGTGESGAAGPTGFENALDQSLDDAGRSQTAVGRDISQLVQAMSSFGSASDHMAESRLSPLVDTNGFRSEMFKTLSRV